MNSQADITNLDLLPVRDQRGDSHQDLFHSTLLDSAAQCTTLLGQIMTEASTGCQPPRF